MAEVPAFSEAGDCLQILDTDAKCQGRYCKHQVLLFLLYDPHC